MLFDVLFAVSVRMLDALFCMLLLRFVIPPYNLLYSQNCLLLNGELVFVVIIAIVN